MVAPQIVPYDPAWPSLAAEWIGRLREALPPGLAAEARLDHIGSTAVPGLASKAFLDLQLLVPRLPAEDAMTRLLTPCGLVRARGARPDSPGVSEDTPRPGSDPSHHEKLLFVREGRQGTIRGVILHVRRRDSAFADFVLSFRDWLRADERARDDYAEHKRVLSEAFAGAEDYDDYTRAKSEFMDEAQARMGWPSPS